MKISYHSLSFYFQRTLWSSPRELWWHCATRSENFDYEELVCNLGNSKASIHCVLCAWPWWHHCHSVDLVLDGRAWLLERVRPQPHGRLLSHLASGKATLLAGQQVFRSLMFPNNGTSTWFRSHCCLRFSIFFSPWPSLILVNHKGVLDPTWA